MAFFLFGLVFGSFLNVCIYRLPRALSVVSPRSFCPGCSAPIAAYDNIPVVSWIILRGRCRNCGTRISPRYALVELFTGALFLLSYLSAGTTAQAVKLCVFSFLMIGLIFTDAETKLLPDLLTKPGIVAGLLFSLIAPVDFVLPEIKNLVLSLLNSLSGLPEVKNLPLSLLNSLSGAIVGSGFILGIVLLYEALRHVEGMGRGDVKLMALIGAFLGLERTLLALLLGSLIGSVFGVFLILLVWRKRLIRRRGRIPSEPLARARSRAWQSARLIYRNFQIPFGVFLGIAALFAAFWGRDLIGWYKQFYELRLALR